MPGLVARWPSCKAWKSYLNTNLADLFLTIDDSYFNKTFFCFGGWWWARHGCHSINLVYVCVRACMFHPAVHLELLNLCTDKNNLAQLLSLMSRNAIWTFHSGKSKVNVTQACQGHTWLVSCPWTTTYSFITNQFGDGNQHFLLFLQCFLPFQKTYFHFCQAHLRQVRHSCHNDTSVY